MRRSLIASCLATLIGALSLSTVSTAIAQTPPAPAAPATPAPVPDDGPKPADIAARPALILKGSATWEEGYGKIHETLEKLRAAAQKAGLKPLDHPMAAFTDTDEAGFKYDALLPVEASTATPTLPDGVTLGATPAGKAIKFTHTGSYDDIDTTYDAVTAYLDEKGLEATNIYLEDYLVEGKDASDQNLKVDIYVFLK